MKKEPKKNASLPPWAVAPSLEVAIDNFILSLIKDFFDRLGAEAAKIAAEKKEAV